MTPKAFPHCPIITLREAFRAPQKGCTLLLLKVVVVGQSCFWQFPFPSLPFFSTHHFWNPALWFTSASHSLPLFKWLSSSSRQTPTSKMAAPQQPAIRYPPATPAPGPRGLRFKVANLDTGVFALLSSVVSRYLRLLCSFNQRFILVR